MLEVGQDIDRYTIERVLGQGGMAVVYLVKHHQLGSQHALKVLTVGSRAITERMMQEGRVQATLRHPNVVAVHDILDIADSPGLLMEFVEGPALDELFMDEGRPDPALAMRIFEGTAMGVHHAHQQGLIHRDLKPGNIMLQPSGRHWIPKVTDFGLAKLVSGDTNLSKTRSGVAMGTPSYMSPEQIRDAKNVDRRTDVWALGAILYELYTGFQAFPGENILEIFNKVSDGDYVDPLELNPDIPPEVLAAIAGALQIDAEKRISDAQALVDVALGETSLASEFVEVSSRPVNPTLAPGAEAEIDAGLTLAPESFDELERGQDTVMRPGAGTDTIIDPRQANAPIRDRDVHRLAELGISNSSLEPIVVHTSGTSLPVVLGAVGVTAAAIGLAVFLGIRSLAPDPQPPLEPVSVTQPAVQPAVQPVNPTPSVEPEVAPKVAPAIEPRAEPVPAPVVALVDPKPAPAPAASGLATTWSGVLGTKPLRVSLASQRGTSFEGSATVGGHPMNVKGSVSGDSVSFAQVGGTGSFTGKVRADGRWHGKFTRQEGAAEEQWFLQPR